MDHIRNHILIKFSSNLVLILGYIPKLLLKETEGKRAKIPLWDEGHDVTRERRDSRVWRHKALVRNVTNFGKIIFIALSPYNFYYFVSLY